MKKLVKLLFIITISIFLVVGYVILRKVFFSPKGNFNDELVEIRIKPGLSLKSIADTLQVKGIIQNSEDFILTNKLFRNVNKLKAGRYDIPKGLSNYEVMKIIVEGKISNIKVLIPEGYTSFRIAGLLARKMKIDSANFIALVNDQQFVQDLGLDVRSLEGYIFPNTYYFYWGISDREILKVCVNELFKHLTDSLKMVIKERGWEVHQILTIASLIEGEAMLDSERPIVSAIYHNRLKNGMLLQSCPTVQYILPGNPRRLLNKDLEIDSPYNTYIYPGLPPGPVNNPGIQSILAAINPAEVDYLYLVAKGDGSHVFSKTLNQHLKAKKKFDEFRREIQRKKRQNARKR